MQHEISAIIVKRRRGLIDMLLRQLEAPGYHDVHPRLTYVCGQSIHTYIAFDYNFRIGTNHFCTLTYVECVFFYRGTPGFEFLKVLLGCVQNFCFLLPELVSCFLDVSWSLKEEK